MENRRTPTRDQIISFLDAYGMAPIKRLGQNFLIDEMIARNIIDAAKLRPGDSICEIGPGFGALTFHLAETGLPITAVELDAKLHDFLKSRLATFHNVTMLHEDALKTDLSPFSVILSNLPYYITTSLIERTYRQGKNVKTAVFMIQKDVFPRLVAQPRDDGYGPLAIILRYMADISPVVEAKPQSFYPEPPVESLVVAIHFKKGIDHEFALRFDKFLRQVFQNRRKTITNNLGPLVSDRQRIASMLEQAGIDGKKRPEELDMEQLLAIMNSLHEPKR